MAYLQSANSNNYSLLLENYSYYKLYVKVTINRNFEGKSFFMKTILFVFTFRHKLFKKNCFYNFKYMCKLKYHNEN